VTADTGSWPARRSATLDWLVTETHRQRFVDNLFGELCNRLVADGIPLARATMHVRTLHPQFMGARMLWRPGMTEAELVLVEHGIKDMPAYANSPVRALYEGADAFRQRLDIERPNEDGFPIYAELRAQGITDYVALPLEQTDGKRHASSWATDRPGGFSTEDLVAVSDLLPVLAMAVEIRVKNRVAKNLLNAYVGPRAGEQILSGAIVRGSGMTVHAAIWTSDLRGFTRISQLWPRDDVIALLNDYFDTMAEPVERNGGEIMKFIGDALLAIFPLDSEGSCGGALKAALEARRGMRELNRRRIGAGDEALGFGLALHVGDVMYGNIGSRNRLDFTVIGPAVNAAARLQELSKELRRNVLVSQHFVDFCPSAGLGLELLGRYGLRDIGEEMTVYALPEPA
jgi:adenylate cyclase